MMEELRIFRDVVADPYQSLIKWKEQHPEKKVIGLFPMHLPEEMVHAAGMLPVMLWESNEPITVAHSHYTPYNCALSRSVIDDAIKGKLAFLDGMLFYDTCLQAKGLPFVIGRNAAPKFLEATYIPAIIHPMNVKTSRRYLLAYWEALKEKLENYAGKRFTDEDLSNSILVYNENRLLLRRVYEIRQRHPWLLRARDVLALVWSSMLMDKEEHNSLLRKLLPVLEKQEKEPLGSSSGQNSRPRLVVSGHLCFAPKPAMLDLIEDMGTWIVGDDLFTGWRYIANDCSMQGNPLESLVDDYLLREPPCLTKVDWETHAADFILSVVRRSGANGVVQLLVKFCPPHLCVYPEIKRRLSDSGVSEIMVETEHELTGLEQMRTKVQTFVETLGWNGLK